MLAEKGYKEVKELKKRRGRRRKRRKKKKKNRKRRRSKEEEASKLRPGLRCTLAAYVPARAGRVV